MDVDPGVFHSAELGDKIREMQSHGSSLEMNWAEDGVWEVAFISGGKRYCGFSANLLRALNIACQKAQDAARVSLGGGRHG
jgi:hypothetical protein